MFVDGPDLDQWREALSEPTAAVFFETPSNPMQELVDIAGGRRDWPTPPARRWSSTTSSARRCSPGRWSTGADVVVYSATKHIDGQGRTLGGAVLGTAEFIDGPVADLMRHTGPAMSPFNAWVLLKGLETLSLRVREAGRRRAGAGAGRWRPARRSSRVVYPWLESHPQHELAKAQMYGGGTVVTFELDGGKDAAFALLDALQVIDISNNLGDSKSLITHPATTTHRRMGRGGAAGRRHHRRRPAGLGRPGGRRATWSRTSSALAPGRTTVRPGPAAGLGIPVRRPGAGGSGGRLRGGAR